jgi:GNAT superfamily N-acetyltransferase
LRGVSIPPLDLRPIDLLDPAQQAAGEAFMQVHAAAQRHLFGDRGSAWSLVEVQEIQRRGDRRRIDRAVWRDGRLVGALEVMMPVHDNLRQATIWLSVEPEHRGLGVGAALLAEAERIAAAEGRTILVAETEWAEGRRDEAESFAARHGYAIAQTVLRSEQTLGECRERLEPLARSSSADYVVESFVDDMPEGWLADRAVLQQRMSTDAPTDDLDTEEEAWTPERLREAQAWAKASGRRVVESAAKHVPSGRLVGFSTIGVSASTPDLGYQQDTLVLKEHRGHRLGRCLKAANALLLMDSLPEVATVRTWNSATNEHMLAVNRELGYVVDGYSREWQKTLT